MIDETEFFEQPIKSLQQMLRTISFHDERIERLVADGVFGPETEAVVRSYQRSRGLPESGVADEETWNRIREEYIEILALENINEPPVFGDWRLAVEPGIYHPHLYLTQSILTALKRELEDVPEVEHTGINDEKTTRALRWVQNRTGLNEDGVFDKFTWEMLNGLYYMYLSRNPDYLPRP